MSKTVLRRMRIPVSAEADRSFKKIKAVVDKNLTSSQLAMTI
jgi:carbamate kinase